MGEEEILGLLRFGGARFPGELFYIPSGYGNIDVTEVEGVIRFNFGNVEKLNAFLMTKARKSLGEIKKIPSSPKIVIKPKERGEFILRCSLKRAQKTRPDFKKHFSKALQIKEDGGKLLIIFDDKCEMFKHLMSEMARILDLTLIAPHFVDKGVEQSAGNDLPPLLADSRSPVVT